MTVNSFIKGIDGLLSPVVESLGYELIELEYLNDQGRWILRLYIDYPESDRGITISDCEKVSRVVGSVLEVEDSIPGKYNLEVSSPGIERPLRREKDFEKYKGRTVKIKTFRKIANRKNFKGELSGITNGAVDIMVDAERIEIPVEAISHARLIETGKSGGK